MATMVVQLGLATMVGRAGSRGREGRTGMATMGVQVGLATMPLGIGASASGLASGTTRGTSGSLRQAEELSMTVAPAAATFGARVRDVVAPAENSARSRSS